MSECFLVFAGGSGSMVLESVVHMAAVSALADTPLRNTDIKEIRKALKEGI